MGASMSEEGSSQARNAKNQGPGAEWFQSAATGDVETLRDFAEVAIDNDLDVKDSRGYTALMIAAMKGHVAGVRLLAQYGADLNAADSRGWTATTHAAFNGQHGCLSLLAEGGADLDAKDFLGTTAAIRAALGGHEHCLMVLADHGADLLTVDNLGLVPRAPALPLVLETHGLPVHVSPCDERSEGGVHGQDVFAGGAIWSSSSTARQVVRRHGVHAVASHGCRLCMTSRTFLRLGAPCRGEAPDLASRPSFGRRLLAPTCCDASR
mmetsp:Transcript_80625/g.261254  ORF Transcript_80625/g.261254 Transcript_80625/m.261254 type:complete len:266 (-) Transcript_80625:76-873(-)